MGSRGSVIPLSFNAKSVPLITDQSMTRFNISARGVDMVLWALKNSIGGEFWCQDPNYQLLMLEAIGPSCAKPVIGIRPGEKIHEEMITSSDSFSTIDLGGYYAILPSDGSVQQRYVESGLSVRPVDPGFAYNSGSNPDFLSVKQIRDLIRLHVDSAFQPV